MNLQHTVKALVNIMLAVVGFLLGLRFILKLFGANTNNDFVNWVYENSSEILGPFRNIFPSANLDGFVIEFSTIFALIVYGLIGMFAFYFIEILTPKPTKKRRK